MIMLVDANDLSYKLRKRLSIVDYLNGAPEGVTHTEAYLNCYGNKWQKFDRLLKSYGVTTHTKRSRNGVTDWTAEITMKMMLMTSHFVLGSGNPKLIPVVEFLSRDIPITIYAVRPPAHYRKVQNVTTIDYSVK